MASHPDTKIDCSKVYVKKSTFSNEETGDFDGAFAAVPMKEGKSLDDVYSNNVLASYVFSFFFICNFKC